MTYVPMEPIPGGMTLDDVRIVDAITVYAGTHADDDGSTVPCLVFRFRDADTDEWGVPLGLALSRDELRNAADLVRAASRFAIRAAKNAENGDTP